ncbi:hypothetical protein [Maribacter sp. 2-571]|uniref:hypothetical protein n=1 Tax=Maribacter sp. 2-571 TaxID=3417569 RepID=UPI003D331FCA
MKTINRLFYMVITIIVVSSCSKETAIGNGESVIDDSFGALGLETSENESLRPDVNAKFTANKEKVLAVMNGKLAPTDFEILGKIPSTEVREKIKLMAADSKNAVAIGDYASEGTVEVKALKDFDAMVQEKHKTQILHEESRLSNIKVGDLVVKVNWTYDGNHFESLAIGNFKEDRVWESILAGLYTVSIQEDCQECGNDEVARHPITGELLDMSNAKWKYVDGAISADRLATGRTYCHRIIYWDVPNFWGGGSTRLGWAYAQLTVDHDQRTANVVAAYASSESYMRYGDNEASAEIVGLYSTRVDMRYGLGLSATAGTLTVGPTGFVVNTPVGGARRIVNSGLTRYATRSNISCRNW